MDDVIVLLRTHNYLIDSHINQISNFMDDRHVQEICVDFEESKTDKPLLGFNVFTLTSDLYYRENYHSDIIKAFIDPSGNHNQGSLFLRLFIDMVNKSFSNKVRIGKKDYQDAVAKREDGKLDIVVYSEGSGHCFIIENKINNAGDMPRQLPRYYDYMVSKKFVVDAIIYLPLQQTKRPDTSDWSQKDISHVMPILCHLPAFTRDGTPNLVDKWIMPCSMITNDIDCHSILRQYGSLVKSLSRETMDKIIVSKFYDTLLQNNNKDVALSIRAMLDDVSVVMADRLYEKLLGKTSFGNVWTGYKPNFCGVIFKTRDREYKIDTYSSLSGYEIHLFPNETDRTVDIPWSETLDIVKNSPRQESGEYVFRYPFKAEDEVVSFIGELLKTAELYDSKQV